MTKADQLGYLKPLLKLSTIDSFILFSTSQWESTFDEILDKINQKDMGNFLIVRSSAVVEDNDGKTQAGVYKSVLNVPSDDKNQIISAVNAVIKSYHERKDFNPYNKIIVQKQLKIVKLSGVIFTRIPKTGSPYYLIEYDDYSGKTNLVTGAGKRKYLCVFRQAVPYAGLHQWNDFLNAIKEIEELFPDKVLEIEFGIDDNLSIHIFQVREIHLDDNTCDNKMLEHCLEKVSQQYMELSNGGNKIYSDMSDWNPAEMIGSRPGKLAISLYRFLITKHNWAKARKDIGYTDCTANELMVIFGGKPYIDVEVSLRSLIPASLPDTLKERLITFQLNKLRDKPYLHDKIEFDITYSCLDILSSKRTSFLFEAGFTSDEIVLIDKSLLTLTQNLLSQIPSYICRSKRLLEKLAFEREAYLKKYADKNSENQGKNLESIRSLLQKCRDYGVYPFSQLARLAFIGNYLLKQLMHSNVISRLEYESFFSSLKTIPAIIKEDRKALNKGRLSQEDFMEKYGHLRPGTYDIAVLRYDQIPHLILSDDKDLNDGNTRQTYEFKKKSLDKIATVLKNSNLELDASFFMKSIKEVIKWREKAKFEFTHTLSDIIEVIANTGNHLGFSRQQMSHLEIEEIISAESINSTDITDVKRKWAEIIEEKFNLKKEINDFILLPSVITSKVDFLFFKSFEQKPNYTTNKIVEAPAVLIDDFPGDSVPELVGKIVVIEAADPGYDWIFLRGIAGLVTKYGGVASHMTIRCEELNIPAAIGCGDFLFDEITKAKIVCINAQVEQISVID